MKSERGERVGALERPRVLRPAEKWKPSSGTRLPVREVVAGVIEPVIIIDFSINILTTVSYLYQHRKYNGEKYIALRNVYFSEITAGY